MLSIFTDADGKVQAIALLASAHTPILVWDDKAATASVILNYHRQSWNHLYSRALQNFTGSPIILRYGLLTTSERKTKYEELRSSLRAVWDTVRKQQHNALNELLSIWLEKHGPAVIEDAKAQIAAIDYDAEMERTEEIVAAVRLKAMISAPSTIPCAHLDW
ncbi:hypothetical protein CKAH01_16287 [Colletotrichum kahawae]|uniref:Uncharacterized protein n=1 Tax=Colletotrichum kahawae TaxID=34407 RepID=A0AAD9YGL9_COLKA|nr:hypothetical protein CKAH01_16287 [Colletotrichum kahawae]